MNGPSLPDEAGGFEFGFNYHVHQSASQASNHGLELELADPDESTLRFGDWFLLTTNSKTKIAHLKIGTSHTTPAGPIRVLDVKELIIELYEEDDT